MTATYIPTSQIANDPAGILWLEKRENQTGKTTLEDIKDALDEYRNNFNSGNISKAEILTLHRAYPDSPTYKQAAVGIQKMDMVDPLVIGGPASVEMIDREGHLITTNALNKAFKKFMDNQRTRNVMVLHSDVQVGWALPAYISKGGQIFKSGVGDSGLFFICELRDDTAIAKKVADQINQGMLKSYSIAGSATKIQNMKKGETPYMQVDEMELAEVTICEKGVNQGASFELLKAELPQTGKIDKDQCGYRDATAPETKMGINCGHCKYFNSETRTCDVVVGDIMPGDYCRLFAPCEEKKPQAIVHRKIVIMRKDTNGQLDFANSFLDWMEKAKKEEDPLKSGKSFATLNNFAGREAEHHRLLQEYGFPSEPSLDSMRYIPVVETETDDDGKPINIIPPWVVNEAGQDLGDKLDEDAPSFKKSLDILDEILHKANPYRPNRSSDPESKRRFQKIPAKFRRFKSSGDRGQRNPTVSSAPSREEAAEQRVTSIGDASKIDPKNPKLSVDKANGDPPQPPRINPQTYVPPTGQEGPEMGQQSGPGLFGRLGRQFGQGMEGGAEAGAAKVGAGVGAAMGGAQQLGRQAAAGAGAGKQAIGAGAERVAAGGRAVAGRGREVAGQAAQRGAELGRQAGQAVAAGGRQVMDRGRERLGAGARRMGELFRAGAQRVGEAGKAVNRGLTRADLAAGKGLRRVKAGAKDVGRRAAEGGRRAVAAGQEAGGRVAAGGREFGRRVAYDAKGAKEAGGRAATRGAELGQRAGSRAKAGGQAAGRRAALEARRAGRGAKEFGGGLREGFGSVTGYGEGIDRAPIFDEIRSGGGRRDAQGRLRRTAEGRRGQLAGNRSGARRIGQLFGATGRGAAEGARIGAQGIAEGATRGATGFAQGLTERDLGSELAERGRDPGLQGKIQRGARRLGGATRMGGVQTGRGARGFGSGLVGKRGEDEYGKRPASLTEALGRRVGEATRGVGRNTPGVGSGSRQGRQERRTAAEQQRHMQEQEGVGMGIDYQPNAHRGATLREQHQMVTGLTDRINAGHNLSPKEWMQAIHHLSQTPDGQRFAHFGDIDMSHEDWNKPIAFGEMKEHLNRMNIQHLTHGDIGKRTFDKLINRISNVTSGEEGGRNPIKPRAYQGDKDDGETLETGLEDEDKKEDEKKKTEEWNFAVMNSGNLEKSYDAKSNVTDTFKRAFKIGA